MAENDPLIDVCMSFTINVAPGIAQDREKFEKAKAVVTSFIAGELRYYDAEARFHQIVGKVDPIKKIQEIISISPAPLPEGYFGLPTQGTGSRKKTRSWASEEDFRLLAGVHRFGLDAWSRVAQFVGSGRTRSQCSQRWFRVLDPKISKEVWTKDESKRLLDLVSRYGSKSWTKIAAELGDRSDVQCRYHYKQLQKEGRTPVPAVPQTPPAAPSNPQIPPLPPGLIQPPRPAPVPAPMAPIAPIAPIPASQQKERPVFPSIEEMIQPMQNTARPRVAVEPAETEEGQEEGPIPLQTSLDGQRSDPVFDSAIFQSQYYLE